MLTPMIFYLHTLQIIYPLNLGVELTIFPFEVETVWKDKRVVEAYMSPGYFIWVIGQEYKRIYEEHEKYGVWGHALTDLCLEGFIIKDALDVIMENLF
jgi:hypothetical protein